MSCCSALLVFLLLAAGQQQLASAPYRKMTPVKMVQCDVPVDLFRLPTHIRPLHYRLILRLQPSTDAFTGEVVMKLRFKHAMDKPDMLKSRSISRQVHPYAIDRKKIILNAEGLKVQGARFSYREKEDLMSSICHDAANKILVIELKEPADHRKQGLLTLKFEGTVQTEAKGLFKSYVQSSQVLVTHFEPNYARRVFPCFDEPEFKATFGLTIQHLPGIIALSNMPAIKVTEPSAFFSTTFENTLEMSSYSLRMVVGKLKLTEDTSWKDGMKLAIYAPMECAGPARSILSKALKVYGKMVDYFAGIRQSIKKFDIVAVDMNIGAMENWGLVTIKWNLLCTQEELLKPEDQIYAVTAITHMMVRLWLGNLVTVRWWDDLWFIEGLANYLTTKLTRELFPELDSKMYRLMDTTYSAMIDDDDPRKTHPIQCDDPQTIEAIQKWYDSLTCKKSEALIRMLAHHIGEDKFKSAMHDFIKSYSEGKLIEVDGWWQKLTGINMLEKWIQQAGYPIISISITSEGRLSVRQESNLGDGKFWPVPISYEIRDAGGNCLYESKFFLTDMLPKVIPLPPGFNPRVLHHWLKFNPNYEGYYRVEYKSPVLLEAFVPAVESGRMPPVDRFQLLSDSYALAKRAGSMDDFGGLLERFSGETNDGVVLLLTKLLVELHNKGLVLALSDPVVKLMTNYYTLTGSVSGEFGSHVLRQYVRGRVLDYLVFVLKNRGVTEEVRIFRKENGGLPPSFEAVDQYLSSIYWT